MATTRSALAQPNLTIIDLILFDHMKVRRLYQEFQATDVLEAKQTLCWELIRQICLHTYKEEMVLYPVVKELLGEDVWETCLTEHMEVKRLLDEVDKMTADDPGFVDKVEEAMSTLFEHLEEEETDFLPKLRQAIKDENYFKELAVSFDSATKQVPTRPHPEAPTTPPANFKSNFELMMEDTIKDQQRFEGGKLTVPMPTEAMETTA